MSLDVTMSFLAQGLCLATPTPGSSLGLAPGPPQSPFTVVLVSHSYIHRLSHCSVETH